MAAIVVPFRGAGGKQRLGSLPAGQAAASPAGAMAARWVIHVVGPVYSHSEDRRHLLRRHRPPLQLLDGDQPVQRALELPHVAVGDARHGLGHATLQVEPDDHRGCDEITW